MDFTEAITFLKESQQILAFDEALESNFTFRTAVVAAIRDANAAQNNQETLDRYRSDLNDWVTLGGPNEELPIRSNIALAQYLIFEHLLQTGVII